MRRLLRIGLLAVAWQAPGCGDGDTATGNGGFDFDAGGGCAADEACVVPDKLGACAAGKTECGTSGPVCSGPSPTTESCNGVDDDCNGVVDDDCPLTLTAFAADGTAGVPIKVTSVAGNGSASIFAEALLGAGLPDGWLRFTSTSPLPLAGVAASLPLADVTSHVLSPMLAPASASKAFVLPYYRTGDDGSSSYGHAITLVNPGGAGATVTVERFAAGSPDAVPASVPVPAQGSATTSVAALFGVGGFEQGFLRFTSDQAVLAAYQETRSSAADAAGDAGWPGPATAQVLPYFVAGQSTDTGVRLSTESVAPVTVTLRVHTEGAAPAEATVDLPGVTATSVSLQALFGFSKLTEGWLEVSAPAAVSTSALVDDGAGGIALLSPADALDTVHWLAGASVDVETAARTDLSLANPSVDAAVAVTLQAFNADGSPFAQTTLVLGPGGARVVSLGVLFDTTAFQGWVRVASDRPITGAWTQHSAAPGIGATRLLHGLANEAIAPDLRSLGSGLHTSLTLVAPERAAFQR